MRKLLLVIFVMLTSFDGQQTKVIKLEFSPEEVQIIFDALGELPAKKTEGLRAKIYNEATKQMR
jgi:hypothetical protein